jgi:hypothetical protein
MSSNGEVPENTPDFTDKVWGAVVDIFVNSVKSTILSGLIDDVFPPRIRGVTITSPNFRFPNGSDRSPEESAVFSAFGGVYEVVYFWQVSTVA